MTEKTYAPKASCPSCRRAPNVRYTAGEVRRMRRERGTARVNEYRCQRCHTHYWILAVHIAKIALPDDVAPRRRRVRRNGIGRAPRPLPDDLPWREVLLTHGIRTMDELTALRDLTSVPYIGESRAAEITRALYGSTPG
jgi:hypothetical protein